MLVELVFSAIIDRKFCMLFSLSKLMLGNSDFRQESPAMAAFKDFRTSRTPVYENSGRGIRVTCSIDPHASC